MGRGLPKRLPTILIGVSSITLVLLLALTIWQARASNGPVVINGIAAPPVPALAPDEIARGERLYASTCASCHGARLEGQPQWRVPLANGLYPAPPHDESGHTWHHGDALLTHIVREGSTRTPSGMPAFGAQLTDAEIGAILSYLKSTWGREEREYQWWVTATQE